MDETSLSLLDQVRDSDDTKAWNRLHDLYAPLMKRWLATFDVQDADADDLIQDAFSAVLKELPAFDHNRRVGAFRNWLRKILAHRLRNLWRTKKYAPQVRGSTSVLEQLNQLEDDQSDVSRIWNSEHDRHVMSQLTAVVRPRFETRTWEAFRRQVFDGQRADVVAAELEMSLSSVYVARSRVLSALRQVSAGLVDS